jgi:hypothetical protein
MKKEDFIHVIDIERAKIDKKVGDNWFKVHEFDCIEFETKLLGITQDEAYVSYTGDD